eukprot:gene12276-2918_t
MEDFPRGGASALSPLEVRKIKESAAKDVLFGKTIEKEAGKPKKKVKEDVEEEGTLIYDPDLISVESLTFKRVVEGMKVLGCIKDIQKMEIVVSLPNSMTGFVPITCVNEMLTNQLQKSLNEENEDDEEANESSVLPSLDHLFKVGQFVPLVVKKLDLSKYGYKKISLSLDPKDLNHGLKVSQMVENMLVWGYVSSIEDHGCIVSFGTDGVSGFISKNKEGELKLGHVQWFLVQKVGSRVLNVSSNMNEIIAAKYKPDKDLALESLYPGALVNASTKKVSSRGVVVSFSGFKGVIDSLHLPGHGAKTENKDKDKKTMTCRIIYVNPLSKMIGLSATSDLVNLRSDVDTENFIGDIHNCTIETVDSKRGLVVELSNGKKGYVNISKVSDKKIDKIGKKFKVGSVHKSTLERPFLRYADIKPGMVVEGTIVTLEDFGILVKLSDQIKGLCPKLHLADINLKHPEKKFVDGKSVKCRVIAVKPEKKRLTLTHKKTLVNSELPIVTSYSKLERGMEVHGYIDSIRDFGLIIKFYNYVKGLAPIAHLSLQEGDKIEDVFYIGQVVKCRVLYSNAETKKLTLTFKSLEELNSRVENAKVSLKVFEKTDGQLLEVKSDSLVIQLPHGGKVHLSKEHLSDFDCNTSGWMFLYGADKDRFSDLKDLVHLGVQKTRRIVSKKELINLVAESKEFVTDFSQIKVGLQTVGVVHHIMQYGIFVELAPGIVGLAPNSNIASYFVSSPSNNFHVGQTVLVKVSEVDEERKRFLVTLNPKEVTLADSKSLSNAVKGENLLCSLLKEKEEVLTAMKQLPAGHIQLLPDLVGQLVNAKVMSVKQEGVSLQTENGTQGFIPAKLRAGIDVETGDVIKCLAIDIDLEKFLFIGTLLPEIIDIVGSGNKKKKKLKSGDDVEVIVQLVSADYILAAVPDRAIPVAYIVAREHLNDIRDAEKRYFIGQKLRATIASTALSRPILICQDTFDGGKPKLGEIVTASVKAIKASQLNVSIRNTNLHGRIFISEIWDEIKAGQCPLDGFKNGDLVRCKLIGFRDFKTSNYLPISHQHSTKVLAELSCRPSVINSSNVESLSEPKAASQFKKGETVPCFVKAVSESFLTVFVNPRVYGKVAILHSSTDKKVLKHFTSNFKHGAVYNATVLHDGNKDENLELSLVGNITDEVKKNGIVCGKITKVLSRSGLLVELPGHKCGLAHITELYDEYKENPLEEFKPKMFVKCCILSVRDDDQIDLSLRPSRTTPEETEMKEIKDRAIHSLDDIHENDIIRGYVKSASSCGVFVNLSSKIVGRVQIKNLSKYFVKNWQELFPVGKLVKAKVLSINPSTNQIELSLRGPDVNDVDPAPPPPKRRSTENTGSEPSKKRTRRTSGDLKIELQKDTDSDDDELLLFKDDESDSDKEETIENKEVKENKEMTRLKLPSDFDWNANLNEEAQKRKHDSDSESEEDDEQAPSAKKSKRQKRAEKKAEEEYLYKTELALLDKDRGPETADDYDRMLLGSPNNSMLWIQYMAFFLNSADIDKARTVVERALKTISFREEKEKLNVWIASLNLECLYGTDETVQNVFNEAVKRNEPKKIYLKMADIYIRNNKPEKAEKLYQVMTKRFNTSKKVWISYGFYLMKNGKAEAARKLLQRSFQSLPVRKHINTILKFALMEFKFGEAEKGVTMFESVLKNHPKRTDIWSVYIDMLIKDGEYEQVRNVFEKVLTLNLSTKKVKFVFKRYLEFEKKHGDEKRVEGVKTKALEYVASKNDMS